MERHEDRQIQEKLDLMKIGRPRHEGIYQILLKRLLNGDLKPGSRINESKLAQELRVSRTPLREALLILTQESLLEMDHDRGYFVTSLTTRQVREIYPILWTLERLALQLSLEKEASNLRLLEQYNSEMAKAIGNFQQTLEIDEKWHALLYDNCPNRHLLLTILTLKQSTHRYEYTYMRQRDLVMASIRQHLGIIRALEQENVVTALDLLQEHWRFSMEALLERLDWS